MRASFLLSLVCVAFFTPAMGQDDGFAVNKIPKELLKNANAVVRSYHTEMNIVSADEIYVDESYAITVLNEKGRMYGVFREAYNQFMTIESVKGRLYDDKGAEAMKMKKTDLQDYARYDVEGFTDDRYKQFSFDYSSYPYTVEYEVKKKIVSGFFMPHWRPIPGNDCAVQNADVEVDYPRDLSFRYHTYLIPAAPVLSQDGEQKKLTLSIRNIVARGKQDEFVSHENFEEPALVCVANKFTLEDVAGDMSTWNGFGRFFYDLNAGRDTLPDDLKKTVHRLVDTCTDTYRKISLLYEYMQKNKRYVNISLGIGGLQEWDAKYVAEKGYGDCKALSNFMKSLLKEAGITARQVLIWGGAGHYPKMEMDFPYSVFNHAILCVPQPNDTIWLECTSKDLPAGYLSPFTEDRNALLITPEGGFPIKTPKYDEEVNVTVRRADLTVTDNNEITGNIDLRYSGDRWIAQHTLINAGKSKTDDYLNSMLAIPTYKVDGYTTSETVSRYIPCIDEHIRLHGTGAATRNGQQVYVSTHIFKFFVPSPTSYEERTDSFSLTESKRIIDTSTITVSGAYNTPHLPKEIDLDFPFASYHARTCFLPDNVIKVCTSYEQRKGTYPPELFEDYIRLSKEINSDAAYAKVALTKKQ